MIPNKEEYERGYDALFRVLKKFGLPPRYSVGIHLSVHFIVKMVVTGNLTRIRAIKPSQERKRLQRMRGLAQKLDRELREINPVVLGEIETTCLRVTALPRFKSVTWTYGQGVTKNIYADPWIGIFGLRFGKPSAGSTA